MDGLDCDIYDAEFIRLCEELEEDQQLFEIGELLSQLHRDASNHREIGLGAKRSATGSETEVPVKRSRPSTSWDHASTSWERPSTSRDVATTSTEPLPDANNVSAKNNNEIECSECNMTISKRFLASHLNSNIHKRNVIHSDSELVNVQLIENAFRNRVATYRILFNENDNQPLVPEIILKNKEDNIFTLLDRSLANHCALKVNFILNADFTQETKQLNNTFEFQLRNNIIDVSTDRNDLFISLINEVMIILSNFERKDSGWSVVKFSYLDININKYNPLRGSSYIDLPSDIKNKKAIINVKNNDRECFRWAVLSGLYPVPNHSNLVSSYVQHREALNFGNLAFPIKLNDIHQFEKMNNISINVFGLEYDSQNQKHDVVGPLHLTKSRKAIHFNLLHVTNGSRGHYCLIKNLSRLVSKQLSNTQHAIYICDGCLNNFTSQDNLNNHQRNDCFHVSTKLPSEQDQKKNWFDEITPCNEVTFDNYDRKLRVPFVIYADFQALTPIQSCSDNHDTSSNTNVQKNEVYSFGYYVKCSYDDTRSIYRTYRGKNCAETFMKSVKKDLEGICRSNTFAKTPLPLTLKNNADIAQAYTCYICDKNLNGDSNISYNHHTGVYEGVAHKFCTEKYRPPNFVPVFVHNLSKHDSNFIVHSLGLEYGHIEVIPESKEKYISFSKSLQLNNCFVKLRFVDSLKFMSSSLDKLARNLSNDQFNEIKLNFPNEEEFKLLIRKSGYYYDMTSYDSLKLTSLPARDKFDSTLTDSQISRNEFLHAQDVWSHFQCQNMGDYADLHLKREILLLTDVFENFRHVCLKTYGLDPAHYYTAAGLSWDAMLRTTKINLELLTDIDKIAFVMHNVRGGISQCSNRHAKANNKFMADYDPNISSSYLMYLDANNLYGWAMSQCLPTGNFEWVNKDTNFHVPDDADFGFILQVDLEYPKELHDCHSDLPFCPENICLGETKEKKFIPNLNNKCNYVIHYRNLKQCLKNGLRLTKVHRVLKFKQSSWLKSYIDLNTHMRSLASSEFERDFFKLMNNSVFGKTMENVAKRVNVKLLNHWENNGKSQGVQSLIAKPEFHSLSIFSENLAAVQLKKTKIFYNKPIYLGFCILDLSKTLMYQFHYDYMKTKYQDNIKLLYTDTDSFIYQIFTSNFYEDIKPDLNLYYDTSGYQPNNEYGLPLINKKRLGFFKDENNGKILKEFVGFRSKMYALDIQNNSIKSNGQMLRFKSMKSAIFTPNINKISITHNDTKRYLLGNSSNTLAWGHYRIPNQTL